MPVSEYRTDRETTYKLEARGVFDSLVNDDTQDEIRSKAYAHHLARACWHGGRIVLRQTSPESEGIFDFIMELHRAFNGRWDTVRHLGIEQEDLDAWLDPASTEITKEEIEAITKLMETKKVAPEITRLQKLDHRDTSAPDYFEVVEILQASAEKDPIPRVLGDIKTGGQRQLRVLLSRGDHAKEMAKICVELSEARKYAATDEQKSALSQLIESFRTGDYEIFRSAHKTWVKDKAPPVEHCMGFLFGYRDPYGARADCWSRCLRNLSARSLGRYRMRTTAKDPVAKELFVRVDRSKIVSHGKPSIGRMLCKIHIWHCTADVNACRPFYESLSAVDGEYEIWRQIVVSKPQPRWKFVQPNTFLKDDGTVELRDYEANDVGIIKSFFERKI
ncbi:hypothetical protein HFD88_004814 [Aspergillus terreus]|nr:hypothetical protein HFD88_004814 [Aspergillus terreus]